MTYRVTTICGSMKFHEDMLKAAQTLSLDGYIVLMPFVTFVGEAQSSEAKKMLDGMHFRKIDMSSEIYVVNPGGYIGESTRNEIEYASRTGKEIRSLEPVSS